MKVKASWVAFVPIFLGTVFLHLYYTFFIGGEEITQRLFGEYSLLINEKTEPEMVVILGAALFVIVLLFSLLDRKTSPECDIKSNIPSGLFAVIAALLLGVDSAVSVMSMFTSGSVAFGTLIVNVFSIAVALILAIAGMGLLIGYNIAKKIRFLMLLPTVWAVVCMIMTFDSHRKEAPSFAFFDVIVWVFLALFLFNNTMVLCGIDIKNPVKSSFVYGLPFILFAVVYVMTSIHNCLNELGYFDFTQLTSQLVLASLAVYAIFSLTDLSGKMKKKKKKVKEDVDTETDNGFDEEDIPESAFGVGSTKYVTAEFEKIRLEKAAQKAKERTGSIPIVKAEDEQEEDNEPISTLDKIDQLIMELSEDDNKR